MTLAQLVPCSNRACPAPASFVLKDTEPATELAFCNWCYRRVRFGWRWIRLVLPRPTITLGEPELSIPRRT